MTEPESEAEVVSLAERRARNQAAQAEARRRQATAQTKVDPSELPPPRVTYVLFGLNVLVWIVMVGFGVDAREPGGTALVDWGGNLGILTSGGQWWRLLSAMFIHAGIFHLGFNLYFSWAVGRACEQIFGALAYAVIYLASGLVASMVSVAWQPAIVSVGASGALFGVFGAFMGFTIRRRGSLPPEFVTMVRRNALILIGLNVAIGLAIEGIDVAAHIGGLIAGLGLGYMIARLAERPVSTKAEALALRRKATGAAAASALVILVAGGLGLPRWDNPMPVFDAAQQRYNTIVDAYTAAGDDIDARAAVLEREAIPAIEVILADFDALDGRRVPELSRETADRLRRHYALRGQAFAKELEALRTGDAAAFAESEQLHADAIAALDTED